MTRRMMATALLAASAMIAGAANAQTAATGTVQTQGATAAPDVGHLYNLKFCMDTGLFKAPVFIQFVFGILGGIGPDLDNLVFMKRTADRLFGTDYRWSVLGAGAAQMTFATTAAAMGGNVRVGLEDSLFIGRGKLAASNAEQVRKIRRILEDLGHEIATPDEARETLALKGGDRVAF